MSESQMAIELKEILQKRSPTDKTSQRFIERLNQGDLTIDENQQSHLCVYFAAYDPNAKQLFMGHHKKSGLWLVNGGHMDKGETLRQTLEREIDEEWGLQYENFNIRQPQLLTITEIYNPEKQPCRTHYDIWHFVLVNKNTFNPDRNKLADEFYENRWVDLEEARSTLIKESNHLKALDFLESELFSK